MFVSGLKAELKQRQLPEVTTSYQCHSVAVPAQSTLTTSAISSHAKHCINGCLQGLGMLPMHEAEHGLQHVAAKDSRRQQHESDQALKAAKLAAVDRLLWQTDFLHQQGSAQSPSGLSTSLRTPSMHSESDSALTSPISSLTACCVWVFISHIYACISLA